MKAMILAAGLGTRLRPLTDNRPKALVTLAGHTLLEITLRRLRAFGVRDVIVNAHHHAEMIADYLESNENFGMRIEVSRETELLDTGGGLKRVAKFFIGDGSTLDEPFILHNVDVICSIDLERMTRFHLEGGALATLAVQDRETSRYLLFDEKGQLRGRRAGREGVAEIVRTTQRTDALGFCGIHIISPRLFGKMEQRDVFSIIDTYLHLAEQGETILSYRADGCYWRDLGRANDLLQAEQDVESGRLSLT
jgi:NDP-sugar pyrophosphorylase family protein